MPDLRPRTSDARLKGGQSLLEYAMCLAIVIAAMIPMQIYVKRGISGKLRAAADTTGEQYDPRKTTGQSMAQAITDTTDTVVTRTEQWLGQNLGKCLDINENDIFGDDCDFCLDSTVQSCDLNGDGTCDCKNGLRPDGSPCKADSDRLFASVTVRCLDRNEVTRSSIETVPPLGTNIWH